MIREMLITHLPLSDRAKVRVFGTQEEELLMNYLIIADNALKQIKKNPKEKYSFNITINGKRTSISLNFFYETQLKIFDDEIKKYSGLFKDYFLMEREQLTPSKKN